MTLWKAVLMKNYGHVPVMVERCLELLAPGVADGSIIIDCTVGMGGHSEAILRRFPSVHLLGIDRDSEALEIAKERLRPFGDRFEPFHTTCDQVGEVADSVGGKVAGILMDLGVSSYQLDQDERGFAYSRDTYLDMRMDTSKGISAADLLRTASQGELARILHVYGEEKFAGKIARALVRKRETEPLTRSGQLAQLVRECIPAPARRKGGNPAKRTFQALRVAVNNELTILEDALPAALESLRVGARLVVESYQSLEDRIVKQAFKDASTSGAPPDLPVVPEELLPNFKLVFTGAQKADATEQSSNPRSAPVRLRAIERVSEGRQRS